MSKQGINLFTERRARMDGVMAFLRKNKDGTIEEVCAFASDAYGLSERKTKEYLKVFKTKGAISIENNQFKFLREI